MMEHQVSTSTSTTSQIIHQDQQSSSHPTDTENEMDIMQHEVSAHINETHMTMNHWHQHQHTDEIMDIDQEMDQVSSQVSIHAR
jgi:hypothetical protein